MVKIFPPEEIAGPRVLLKRHVVGLAEKMFGYVDQDRERLREFLPWVDLTRTVTDEAEYIRMTLQQWESHELFDYGIFRKSDGLYLGNCGVHTISWQHRRCELGYWILGAFEGQGYISEAVRALEATFFELGFNRVEIHCSSSNLRSAKVPRAAGYRLEAIQRQDSIENGRFRDTYVFAKLKHERSASAQPTLLGIDHARLCVGDLQASKAWYAKALGAAPTLDVPDYVEFRIGLSGLAFALSDEKSPPSKGGQIAYWRVHDLDEALRHFTKLGGELYRGPLSIEDGEAICQILDPFGNVIGLIGPE